MAGHYLEPGVCEMRGLRVGTALGNYYVSVRRDDGETRCLAGPFRDDHASALAIVDRASALAMDMDPWAAFYSYGTIRTGYEYDLPGILNGRLGL